jgi:hypothetical protein
MKVSKPADDYISCSTLENDLTEWGDDVVALSRLI